MADTVLGIDWGTTNRRAYALDAQGNLVRQHSDGFGIMAVGGDFENSLKQLLQELQLDRADVIMSGMVGSRNGWREAPYLDASHPIDRLDEAMMEVPVSGGNMRCRIVPGMRYLDESGAPDVMRGEETQIFGALALGAPDGWLVHPGTHCKWALIGNRRVARLRTFMTGEFYSLLSRHGTLAALMENSQTSAEAFEAGLRASQRSALTHAVFGCRALVVTDEMPAPYAASYLSGVLIGTELADMRERIGNGPVQVIGSPELAARYRTALEYFDIRSHVWQPDDVYVAALKRLSGIDKGHEHAQA